MSRASASVVSRPWAHLFAGVLAATPACQDGRPGEAASTSATSATSVKSVKSATSATPAPTTPATGATTRITGTTGTSSTTGTSGTSYTTAAAATTGTASTGKVPGRSDLPTLAEWRAVGEVTVKGSSALGCETKMVREWLRVLCRGKNDTGGTPTRVEIAKGSVPGTFTYAAAAVTSLVTPFVSGTALAAVFSWTDKSHTLRLDWPQGSPKPSILGVFEGAKSPLDQPRATCAGKRRCPPAQPICAITRQGPRCVAPGSPEYQAVSSDNRFPCTHQTDCLGEAGCFFTFGEHEVDVRTYCGPYRGGEAACDLTQQCDPKRDHTCVPCRKLDVPGLPWFGHY